MDSQADETPDGTLKLSRRVPTRNEMPAHRFRRRIRAKMADRLRSQAGFTLIEVMVATILLIIGLLGTVTLIDAANSSQGKSKSREGATNLARELLEDAHANTYKQIGASGWLTTKMAALQGGSGTVTATTLPTAPTLATTVSRRGISYTATVSWCSVDDSKDTYGTHSSSVYWCSDSATPGTTDANPEDMKRVTATITYSAGGSSQTLKETVTFAATGGIVAPSVSNLVPTSTPPGTSPNNPYQVTTSVSDVTFRGTSNGAADMKFTVNGVEVTSGVTNTGGGNWDFDWQIAGLTDGTYTIGAVAVDALGNRSTPMTAQVKLARGTTLTPQNVAGGYNFVNPTGVGNGGTEVVELEWDASPDGSVTGYEVLRGATSVCGGQTNLANSCLDTGAPTTQGTSTIYTVKTWYRDASNTYQSVSTTYSVTAPYGPVATQYWLESTTGNIASPCLNSGGTRKDMVSTAPTGFFTWLSSSTTVTGCLPAFPSGVSMSAGTMTVQSYWTNPSNSKSCNVSWLVHLNGSTLLGTTNVVTVPIGTSGAILVTNTATLSARAFSSGDKLDLFTSGGAANSNCSNGPTTLWYNSTGLPTNVTLPLTASGSTLSTPNTISGLSVTVNADGSRTLNWTAPTSSSTVPAPDFYRIYRDGTATTNRVDATDAINTTVATASAASATTLAVTDSTGYAAGQSILVDTGTNQDLVTISSVSGNTITFTGGMTHAHAVGVPVVVRSVSWTDTAAGGTSHTYRVSAVSANMAESAFLPSAGVTG